MGCSHAESCPQFPLLKASLRGWRDHYCDDDIRWRDCARYQMALAGRAVPITLLPNGKDAQYLAGPPDTGRNVAAEPDRAMPGGARRAAAPVVFTASSPAPVPAQRVPSGPAQRVRVELGARRQSSRPRRGWWTRLMDWMRGQA
ncbi:MAG: hypothetical protein L0H84_11375 [Pseudonocardia sp.]|nr:hypothetical protein [Pseudonocardia sp.]